MGITRPDLAAQVRAALPDLDGQACYRVAYSGGLDSTVLLHLLRHVPGLRAVHVNHGMQNQADVWQQHCQAQCERWAIPLDVRKVSPDISRGGPEAGAREARYAALAGLMQPGDVLLTAQHADDQAETFLLQALRGAGVRGLAAMPARAEFGAGHIARPLIKFLRAQLDEYAQAENLQYVQDPSNADPNLGRAFLRQRVLPQLRERWPELARNWSRSAAWCAQTTELTDALAVQDVQGCSGPVSSCLLASELQALSIARRSNALRYWLRGLALAPPDHRHLQQIEALLQNSRPDAQPIVAWPGGELRRSRDWIFAMPRLAAVPDRYSTNWDMHQPLMLPDGCGYLHVDRDEAGASALPVTVRLRVGGERLRLGARTHHSSLKHLLQSAQVPPWVRARLPLIYQGEELVAVADYWRARGVAQLRWTDAPVGADIVHIVGTQAFR